MFNNLPAEILHLIARDLGSRDLCHLVSSSRRLHTIFQPSLYTDVSLCERSDGCASESQDQTVNKFLYTVTRTPRLADYVWHLRVSCWNVENAENENYDQKVEFDGDLVRGLVGTRSGYSEEEKSTWLNDLERDNSDAWLALLLPQLIELRNLHLVWPYGSQYVLEMLQKAAIEEEAVFPHLEEAYAASEA